MVSNRMAHLGKWELSVLGEREDTWKSAESGAGTPWSWGCCGTETKERRHRKGTKTQGRERSGAGGKQEAPVGVPVNLSPFLWAAMAHTVMDLFSPPLFLASFFPPPSLRVKVTLPPAHVLFPG